FPNSTCIKIWAETQKELDIMLQREREEFSQPEKDHKKVMKMLATCYIKYLEIIRKFKEAHDDLIHQQKRAAVQRVLDGAMGRLLEIKKEMVSLEKSECHYMDDILVDLKHVPDVLEIPIPKYFIKENLRKLQEREKYLDEILLNAGLREQEPVTAMTLEEGIKVIQVAERARQGRSQAAFMKTTYLAKKRQAKPEEQMGKNPDAAATLIQKVWRGYSQRKKTEKLREEEMIFLGMVSGASLPPHLEAMSSLQIGAGKANVLQGEVQEREDLSFMQELRKTEGPHIKETLQDEISQCFIECRHITGRFPDYPPKTTGGSKAIFIEKHPEEVLEAERQKDAKVKFRKPKKKEEKEPKKSKQVRQQKQAVKPETKHRLDPRWKMGPSNFLSILEEGSKQYKVFWENRDNKSDFLQDHDPELIKGGEREEVEEEIRVQQVDEVMQEQLLKLILAVDRETHLRKAGRAEKNSEKKPERHRKARKRGHENLMMSLACRTIESLYRELAEEGLLIKVKNVNISDYIGYHDCLRNLRYKGAHPMPSIPEVRQLVTLYGVLPLGSQTVHENAPLVKSMLLVGPAGVGKKMLVHAICTETGANLFNLTPSNIAGKYPGREGLVMMLHMILKVGKQLQPSVVWIGDVEKVFSKGAAKGEEEMNAKRLATFLPLFLRAVTAKDRVLLVGTTRRPFDADLQPFCKIFQKIILLPKPDYLTRSGKYFKASSWLFLLFKIDVYSLWKHYILQRAGVLTWLVSLHCLAQLSAGFTQGHIADTVQTVLSEKRLLQMSTRPLRSDEFFNSLARHDPVYRKEEETLE
ncbi:DRC11 protein, partial [Pardalotus punctatus]|nr:DRC11 protein [Pardalotus punctatus]